MKFCLADDSEVTTKLLVGGEDSFQTTSGSHVTYEFDGSSSCWFETDSWMNAADIDDLIAFLQFAKTQLA